MFFFPLPTLCEASHNVGKTVTTINLAIGLARHGKKVLLLDCDSQGSATISLGYQQPAKLETTLAALMDRAINDEPINARSAILSHEEGIDFIPANRNLSIVNMKLITVMNRETILRQCLDELKHDYDYILLDCLPSLGMLTINALTASDSVLIPAQPQFLSVKGLEELLMTFGKIRKQINPALKIEGILLSMVNGRTNNAREIIQALRDSYGERLRIFDTQIPYSVRAAETSVLGKSIFAHDPAGKVAQGYEALVWEVLNRE